MIKIDRRKKLWIFGQSTIFLRSIHVLPHLYTLITSFEMAAITAEIIALVNDIWWLLFWTVPIAEKETTLTLDIFIASYQHQIFLVIMQWIILSIFEFPQSIVDLRTKFLKTCKKLIEVVGTRHLIVFLRILPCLIHKFTIIYSQWYLSWVCWESLRTTCRTMMATKLINKLKIFECRV